MRFLGIDVGTTNTKAVVMNEELSVVDTVSFPLPFRACAERVDPAVWVDQFRQTVGYLHSRHSVGQEKCFCGLTTQGGSFVGLDGDFQPVGDGLSWTARANSATVESLADTIGWTEFYRRTGWAPDSWLAVTKWKEMLHATPDIRYFAAIPELIFLQLAGRWGTDMTNAQVTGMFDFNNGSWWPKILRWAGVASESMPSVRASADLIVEQVKVGDGRYDIAGCSHDQYATMFACGLDGPETVVLGTGTAWVINGISRAPLLDEEMFVINPGRDILPGRFGFIASLGAVGHGFDLLLRRLRFKASRVSSRLEGQEPPMEPVEADLEQGTVSGASDSETTVRRFMEAVAAKVRFCLERFGACGTVRKIIMTGGAAQSRLWTEILTNLCQTSVEAVRFPELTAYGAALLARYAVSGQQPRGIWPSTIAVERFEPDSAQVSRYEDWYRLHQRPLLERQALRAQPSRSKRMRI